MALLDACSSVTVPGGWTREVIEEAVYYIRYAIKGLVCVT